jgi:DNA-binding IclR family transcriptional regulator
MPNYKRIGAVDVSCRILRHLSQQTQPVSGMDISEALNIPQPTVMTHLATLADHSFVEAQGERYVVGQGIAVMHARRRAYLSAVSDNVSKQVEEL